MPGLTGPAWLEGSELPQSEGGFIAADERCRVRGMEHVYVAGDAGSYPGPDWMAQQAHPADMQAGRVAKKMPERSDGRTGVAGLHPCLGRNERETVIGRAG